MTDMLVVHGTQNATTGSSNFDSESIPGHMLYHAGKWSRSLNSREYIKGAPVI